jgi:hypothetical protein
VAEPARVYGKLVPLGSMIICTYSVHVIAWFGFGLRKSRCTNARAHGIVSMEAWSSVELEILILIITLLSVEVH